MHRFMVLAAAVTVVALVACGDSNIPSAPIAPSELTVHTSRGALIAQDVCAQCHPLSVGAFAGSTNCPALGVAVRNYSVAEFQTLLTSGTTRTGLVVDAMSGPLPSLAPSDRAALLEYLHQLMLRDEVP